MVYKNNIIYLLNKHKTKIKFLFVGGWNTLFGFLAFVILYKIAGKIFKVDYFAYTSAQILGSILAILNAYIFHKYVTFESKTKGRNMIIEFFKFSTTYIVLFFVSLALMPFFVEVLKIQPILSSVCLNIITITTSYFGHSRFSFKKSHKIDTD
jgi:putative flippase GtrA